MIHQTDVVVIGTGPVGLFAIFECGMLRLKCHAFDAMDQVGGQCAALYPEKPIYDIPAYPSILGGDLAKNLAEQAAPFSPVYHLSEQVQTIEALDCEGKRWRLTGSRHTVVEAKAIIIAAGVGAFGPNRPPLAHIEDFEEHSIHYFVRSREGYRGKNVVIAGGGDSAVDWALSLSEVAARVTVVHRRDKFRAAPANEDRLKQLALEGVLDLAIPYQLSGVRGEKGQLTHVEVESLSGDKKVLAADYLLPFFGLSMNLGPIAEWDLGLTKNHISIDPTTASTNRAGIYAIGDIATYPHKLKLILTGFAEAAQAAHAIRHHLYPDEVIHFEYSTTQGVPPINSARQP